MGWAGVRGGVRGRGRARLPARWSEVKDGVRGRSKSGVGVRCTGRGGVGVGRQGQGWLSNAQWSWACYLTLTLSRRATWACLLRSAGSMPRGPRRWSVASYLGRVGGGGGVVRGS